MQRVRVEGFTISVDGYGAGPNQSLENPLGVGGDALHDWLVHTRTFGPIHGGDGGSTGIDEDFAARGMANVGAWIMGRNMFAPSWLVLICPRSATLAPDKPRAKKPRTSSSRSGCSGSRPGCPG